MSHPATGPFIAGVDLGGTKILSAIATPDGRILARDRRPTEAEEGPAPVFSRIVESLRQALTEAGGRAGDLIGIGVAVPGPVDQRRGVVTDPPNLPGWRDVPIGRWLRDALKVPTVLENDANAAALGEHRYGAGRGSRHMIYLTVSTGIGGGIIIDRKLYRGASGAAGELGHVIIDADGPQCSCGAHGCLEALASGTALARDGAALIARGEAPRLAEIIGQGPVTAEAVAEAARAGDPAAARLIAQAGHYLGLGLTSFVNIFNPQVIVIGGGVAKIGRPFLEPAEAVMRKLAFPQAVADVRLETAALGDDAGVQGAISLVLEKMLPRRRAGG